MTETLATKTDIQELAAVTKQDLRELATKLDLAATKQELHQLAATIKQEMRELELRLTVRLGGMIAVSVGAVAALVRLI